MEKNLAVEKNVLETATDFRVEVKIVPNRDKHQSFKPMRLTILGSSLSDLKARQRQFVDESFTGVSCELPIGGGNWDYKCLVYGRNNKAVGRMAYNGTIWDLEDPKKEVVG